MMRSAPNGLFGLDHPARTAESLAQPRSGLRDYVIQSAVRALDLDKPVGGKRRVLLFPCADHRHAPLANAC